HGVARPDAERGGVAGVDRRRELVLLPPVEDLHDGKIVVDVSPGVRDLEDLAVTAGPLVGALDRGPFRGAAVVKGPLVAGDLPGRAPGARAVQRDLFADRDQVVRPRDGDDLGPVLALVSLPEERVSVLDAPLAGGLLGLDVEMEVRPAAAAPLLAQ